MKVRESQLFSYFNGTFYQLLSAICIHCRAILAILSRRKIKIKYSTFLQIRSFNTSYTSAEWRRSGLKTLSPQVVLIQINAINYLCDQVSRIIVRAICKFRITKKYRVLTIWATKKAFLSTGSSMPRPFFVKKVSPRKVWWAPRIKLTIVRCLMAV